MASARSALIALLAVLSCASAASAARYIVGDDQGWTTGVNYSDWASGKTFAVGDELEFNFVTGKHDVVKAGDDSCSSSSSNVRWIFNESVVTNIDYTGYHHYICSFSDHCSRGMKLTVVVEPGTPPANGASSARLHAGPAALAVAAALVIKLALF